MKLCFFRPQCLGFYSFLEELLILELGMSMDRVGDRSKVCIVEEVEREGALRGRGIGLRVLNSSGKSNLCELSKSSHFQMCSSMTSVDLQDLTLVLSCRRMSLERGVCIVDELKMDDALRELGIA